MKKRIQSLTFMALVCASALVSCSDSAQNKMESTTDSLTSKVGNGMDNLGNKVDSMTNKNADEDFLSDAVEANTMEMKALMIGQQKGSKEVKAHALHMISDHKKLGDDVMAYIKKKNINLTDVDTTGTDDDLNNATAGKDFDKTFADKMVSDHEKVINMFEDAQDDVKDPELKDMITKAIPKLKSHLEMSKQMQDKLSNTK